MLKDANQRVSEFVADVARTLAPVGDSGNLQGSVRGSRQVGRAVVRAGSASVPYAGNNHYGWLRQGAGTGRKGWRGGNFPGSFLQSSTQPSALRPFGSRTTTTTSRRSSIASLRKYPRPSDPRRRSLTMTDTTSPRILGRTSTRPVVQDMRLTARELGLGR